MIDRRTLVYAVDDDASAREGLGGLIRSTGVITKTFASGQDFLAAPRPKRPSCLVSDLDLPGVSGIDLQWELTKSGVQVPMIFLTREGDIPVAVRALKAGAANVIPRPESGSGAFNCSIIFILNKIRLPASSKEWRITFKRG